MMANPVTTLESIFKRTKKDKNNCWIWQGMRHRQGYGIVSLKNVQQGAHRVVWKILNSDISSEQHVCHKCDNPPCVNPDHLFLGNHQQNMQDMVEKKRHNRARMTHCDLGHPLSGDNLKMRAGKRRCRICFNFWRREFTKRKKANESR